MYSIRFSSRAKKELSYFKQKNQQCFKKASMLLEELRNHPYTGRGNPEALKYDLSGCWSRRIDDEHRLVYSVEEEMVMVHVISMRHHYRK